VIRAPGYWSRGPGFDSRRYQIFWEVVGLEQGPLILVSTTEELLGRNISGSSIENREYGHGNPLSWPCDTLYLQKLALTSPTSGGRSVGQFTCRLRPWSLFVCYRKTCFDTKWSAAGCYNIMLLVIFGCFMNSFFLYHHWYFQLPFSCYPHLSSFLSIYIYIYIYIYHFSPLLFSLSR
jgi:hypothetical protein